MVGKSNAKGGGTTTTQYLYGYDLAVATSSPTARVVYPVEVDNADFGPNYMDFTNNVFNYGGWNLLAGEKFMPKPCMLNYDGTVAYYLNLMDYSKKIDGTASDVANTSYAGNAMMEWGKLYTKRSFSDGVYSFRVSNVKIDSGYECWCNYDLNNNEIPHFYTPIYFGSSISGKLRSISGQSNSVGTTRAQEITLATANGNGWYTEVVSDNLLIDDLLIMMARSTNTAAAYGNGRTNNGTSTILNTGTMNTKGLFWGSTNLSFGVKLFGMENLWGNLWRATAGWINASGTQKLKITRGNYDGSVATDYNLDGTNYISLTGATPSGTSGDYISAMKNDLPYGRIPIATGGSSTTYDCDALYFDNAITGYLLSGGSFTITDPLVGTSLSNIGSPSTFADATVGAALSCKPLVA